MRLSYVILMMCVMSLKLDSIYDIPMNKVFRSNQLYMEDHGFRTDEKKIIQEVIDLKTKAACRNGIKPSQLSAVVSRNIEDITKVSECVHVYLNKIAEQKFRDAQPRQR